MVPVEGADAEVYVGGLPVSPVRVLGPRTISFFVPPNPFGNRTRAAEILIRQLAIECGYSAASVAERIYSRQPDEADGPMAGVLLYTAASDSEGTLGGLVALGHPVDLGRHLGEALRRATLCSSDPLCSEHPPGRDKRTIHAAACHACTFVSETSCERGNKYLDRSLLVPTMGSGVPSFFPAALSES